MERRSNKYWFFRAVAYTAVITGCAAALFCGAATAYEGIRRTGFGEDVSAVEYSNGVLSVFGVEITVEKRLNKISQVDFSEKIKYTFLYRKCNK